VQYTAVRAAIHIASIFALYLSVAMLFPAAVDLYYGNSDWEVFTITAFFSGGLAAGIALATQGSRPVLSSRFGFLLVNLLWFTACVVGTAPLLASSLDLDVPDAFFEAVSAVTSTGSTVLVGLDALPPGILLWRSLLQWVGGLGVIALGLFILPFLNVGGVSYFKIESTHIEDQPFDRFSTFVRTLMSIYVMLTFICAIAYAFAGMRLFDAVNHAMTTLATGGFSTHDLSMGFYNEQPAILWIATIFMFIGGLPFSMLILFFVKGRFDALRDPQIKVYAGYVLVFVLLGAAYLRLADGRSPGDALTHSAFNFVSIITTTGFATEDYGLWGSLGVAGAFLAMFLGGCSGSTAGGIKAYRFLILYELLRNGLRKLVYPNSIQIVRYGDRPVEDELQRAVVLYFAAFLVVWAMIILLLAGTGLDLITSVTSALTAITNVGPGLGTFIGPVDNFSTLTDPAKLIMAFAMLLGRLEILAVLVIFTPIFWKR